MSSHAENKIITGFVGSVLQHNIMSFLCCRDQRNLQVLNKQTSSLHGDFEFNRNSKSCIFFKKISNTV